MLALAAFQAEARATGSHLGQIHPGEVVHRCFNQEIKRGLDLSEIISIWDENGSITAWAFLWPTSSMRDSAGFDAFVHPEVRRTNPDVEREVALWAIEALRVEGTRPVHTEWEVGDEVRLEVLLDLGFERGEPVITVNRRSLIDLPEVPAGGYAVRPARGPEEAGEIAAVHRASFGSAWTGEQYARVMRYPGYRAEHELLCVAPDGGLAGFTVVWLDERNRVGIFEPVGTHEGHRRRGVGRRLLAAGMRLMSDAGMTPATVANEAGNPAAAGLYRSMGFEPWVESVTYTLGVTPS